MRLPRFYYHFRRVLLNIGTALWANVYYGFPTRGLTIVGITGTDGKTTTAHLLASMLQEAGHTVGLVSTLGGVVNGQLLDTGLHVSTPGPRQIYALLAQMRTHGVTHVILEVTSHGLDQRRVFGIPFAVAAVTNITPEHLDYHGTFAAYVRAKARLVALAPVAWLNAEDSSTPVLTKRAQRVLRYGLEGERLDVQGRIVALQPDGTVFTYMSTQTGEVAPIHLHLPGRYNVMNALAALGVASHLGVDPVAIRRGLEAVREVAGRWEVLHTTPFTVIVDFAHTPHAFEVALPAARLWVAPGGRLIHVFGSAAQRDEDKRAVMGQRSGQLADITIVTMEDPRNESLDRIQGMILAGLRQSGRAPETVERIDERGAAIARAIQLARPGDVVLITGKGHEHSLAVGKIEYPWSDQEAVRMALAGHVLRLEVPKRMATP